MNIGELVSEHFWMCIIAGVIVVGILSYLVSMPAKLDMEPMENPPLRQVPPIDKAAAFERLKKRIHQEDGWPIHKVAQEIVAHEPIFTLDQVKALTNSAFTVGRTTAWTYQEWEKENLS